MKCIKCNEAIPDDANFCTECGVNQITGEPPKNTSIINAGAGSINIGTGNNTVIINGVRIKKVQP